MNIVKVRNLLIGEGRPKICIPITGRTKEEILLQTEVVKKSRPDLVEWRADWYGDARIEEKQREALESLKEALGELPLLVTFRTKQEGGQQKIDRDEYETFLRQILGSGLADLLDVELFMGEDLMERIVTAAHENGVAVVASSHDFLKTPPRQEILKRLLRMQELGADLLKIALMPCDPGDVLTLLEATWEMKKNYAKQPLITMSMGSMGVISRISGETFGSALTFGAAGQASAPGQIDARKLKEVLESLHTAGEST
ncbi:MAG: type I 3-dehydroquinate dehydratase [Lachnospiraceae bacterium]|nr:type I 3-dehydroquinate dehydratase [Lachnospiraceae bacterium]